MSRAVPMTTEQYNALLGHGAAPARTSPPTRRTATKTTAKVAGGGRRGAQPKATTKAAPKRKRTTRIAAVSGGLAPADAPTRGPWIVAVDWLGRPPTINAERAGAMSYSTFLATRDAQKAWKAAFVEALRHAGVPALGQAFVLFQPFYPTNVVPDPDALSPVAKAGIDSLVEAGVLSNDRREQIPFGFMTLPAVTDGGPPRVVLTISPLP